jgi:hypothetical protein
MATAKAILTAMAMGKVKAKGTATAMAKATVKVKVVDRRREARFAAQVDSGASAWSREHWTARSVAVAVDSLLHRGLERFPLELLLPLHHLAEIVR